MAPLPEGPHRLRYIPNPSDPDFVGGLLATEVNGRDQPINAAPDEHELRSQQVWDIKRVGEDEVEILYIPGAHRDIGGNIGEIGFHYDQEEPGVPIILSFGSKFRLEQVKDNIWRVHVPGNRIGVNFVVGLNEEKHDETLAINAYPVVPDVIVPAWRFERA